MNNLENKTRTIIKKFNIKANKRLGQNFLIDQNVLDTIAQEGEITKDDLVIEIGPGLGVLTAELCKKAGRVVAIELDRRFIDILEDVLSEYNNYKIIQGDILNIDLKGLVKEFNHQGDIKVIANLPYYITTPVIFKLLEEELGIKSIVIMVQKEVAQRITASPGGKEYGALTIAVAYYGDANIVLHVPSCSFIPKPEVDSSVIKIEIHNNPVIDVVDKKLFFKVVRASFTQRRKTILNSIANSGLFGENKSDIKSILDSVGIKENQRPEELSIHDFARLVNKLNK